MKLARGFTLLEVMLVLVLISVSAVAVIATLPARQHDQANTVAQSLFQRLQLLNEEALLSGFDFGLRIDESKQVFTFVQLTEQGWQKVDKIGFAAQLNLDSSLSLDFTLGSGAWQDKDRLFIPGSLFDEQMFAEQNQSQIEPTPQVFILSSGEITPFILLLFPAQASREQAWQLIVADNGVIRLLPPGEHDE